MMAKFTVHDRTPARIPNDFLIHAADGYTPTPDENGIVTGLHQTLERLVADAAADVGSKLRSTLLAARAAWRAAKAGELRAVANELTNDPINGQEATEHSAAIAKDVDQNAPGIAIVDAKPERFAGEFAIAVTNFSPDAGEQAYIDRQKHLFDDLAADEAADAKAKYSDAGLEVRRAQRKEVIDSLRQNATFWSEGMPSGTASANVSFQRGRYSGQRERLGKTLFTVRPIRGKDDETDFNVDIDIQLTRDLPPPDNMPTVDQQELFVEINKADTVISTVCRQIRARAHRRFFPVPENDKRGLRLLGEYMDKLIGIARLGLEGPHTVLAKLALASLREEFVAREAEQILNRYVRRLGLWAAGFAITFLAVYTIVRYQAGVNANPHSEHATWWVWWDAHRAFLLAAAGASVGTWASFSVRQINLTFDQLATPEEELLDAPLRIVFVIVLTMAACLLFWTGAINVKIGDLNTEAAWFTKAGTVAILIGFFCGLSERALASAIAGRASAFVGGIAGSK